MCFTVSIGISLQKKDFQAESKLTVNKKWYDKINTVRVQKIRLSLLIT